MFDKTWAPADAVRMLSLIVHAALGLSVIWWTVRVNPAIFRRTASGPLLSPLEIALYAVGIASIGIGWYFNIRFVIENTDGWVNNPFVGDGSWEQYMRLLFANPAAGSASGDFITSNVVLLPLISIVGGRRLGIQKPWLFFVTTFFASFTFGWAFYAATVERQRRLASEHRPETPLLPTH